MIALGWTLSGAKAPEPSVVVDLPGFAVVASPVAEGARPQARLGLQVACAQRLEAFLPLAPASCVAVEEAVDLARRHDSAIGDRLRVLRGLAQISVMASWSSPVSSPRVRASSGSAWLQARASRRRQEAALGGELLNRLLATISRHSVRCRIEREGPRGVQVAALCPADEVADALDRVACAIERGEWPTETRFAITGPWPALAFAGGVLDQVRA